jgi:2-amino-4-hydroxy-6-hydroxymethyldihydropteridine diphosphokinase
MKDADFPDAATVVALGSNLAFEGAPPADVLEAALVRFPEHGLDIVKRSGWWRSAAWPDASAPAFLNGVALVRTALGPHEVLDALLRIERGFGRDRTIPNAPRTLDLDLIAHGRTVMDEPGLVLPHPRAAERRFVMGPLAEIAPGWRHPVSGEAAEELAAEAVVGADARPLMPRRQSTF